MGPPTGYPPGPVGRPAPLAAAGLGLLPPLPPPAVKADLTIPRMPLLLSCSRRKHKFSKTTWHRSLPDHNRLFISLVRSKGGVSTHLVGVVVAEAAHGAAADGGLVQGGVGVISRLAWQGHGRAAGGRSVAWARTGTATNTCRPHPRTGEAREPIAACKHNSYDIHADVRKQGEKWANRVGLLTAVRYFAFC